jgi:hypothetical protein
MFRHFPGAPGAARADNPCVAFSGNRLLSSPRLRTGVNAPAKPLVAQARELAWRGPMLYPRPSDFPLRDTTCGRWLS